MAQIPDIGSVDGRMRWRPVAPRSASPDYDDDHGDNSSTSDAQDYENPPLPDQGGRRVMRFVLGIFISALIGSGSALAWRTYFDPTTSTPTSPGPPSGPISPAAQASGVGESSQNSAEIVAVLQANKDAIAKLEAAQQTQTQQLSEQLTQLRNLQADIAAVREIQASQQAELRRFSGALAAQKAKQKKAQAPHPKPPAEGDQAAAGGKRQTTAPSATAERPPQTTTGAPLPLH
jgi:hypothetical protein